MATAGGKSIDWNGNVANDGMQSYCGSLASNMTNSHSCDIMILAVKSVEHKIS
jgi:hypothetical protein